MSEYRNSKNLKQKTTNGRVNCFFSLQITKNSAKRRNNMRSTLNFLLVCMVIAGFLIAQPVVAADYPSRPVKMLTMVKPGAQIDLLTRKLADLILR